VTATLFPVSKNTNPAVIPAQTQKNTGHFAGHPEGKNRTFYRTPEVDLNTFVRYLHNCILAVFYW